MKRYILFIVVVFSISGCNFEFWERSGRIPKLDRTDTLAGIDENHDGIRDDIEVWIKKRWKKDIKKQKALLQYAKVNQLEVTVDLNNIDEIMRIDNLGAKAQHCLWLRFPTDDIESEDHPINIRKEVDAYTTNTKKRLKHYLMFNEKLDGTTGRLLDEDTCDE